LQTKDSNSTLYKGYISSPIGFWTLVANDKGLTQVDFDKEEPQRSYQTNDIVEQAMFQLSEYFDRKRTVFELPIDLDHHSRFYHSVWKELQEIAYGSMISYADIANKLNNPKAVRAVGMANGKNPIPIIIPCHRVIGKDRSLIASAPTLFSIK